MSDALLQSLEADADSRILQNISPLIENIRNGDYHAVLTAALVRQLLGHESIKEESTLLDSPYHWEDYISERLAIIVPENSQDVTEEDATSPYLAHYFFLVALAALQAFLQANATGPPLPFSSVDIIIPLSITSDIARRDEVQTQLVRGLAADGIAAYKLIPHVELFCLAATILANPELKKSVPLWSWAMLRVDFLHQRLLSESANASSLETSIYNHIEDLETVLEGIAIAGTTNNILASLALEKATIHHHHGHTRWTAEEISRAAKLTGFDFVLTGRLGKRTKYQDNPTSQLVVLAKSQQSSGSVGKSLQNLTRQPETSVSQPTALELNDDTLLESIAFSDHEKQALKYTDEDNLPETLRALEPGNQPRLQPIDSIILLAFASLLDGTSPADNLIREQKLPYALRVLEGGSSNWQVYTSALLVRSRLEGYRSRTKERGLLQLQALVDQIIVDTTPTSDGASQSNVSTFLPRPAHSETAPANQRLLYIYELAFPFRWEVEAELAARWVSLGGLRSALEIYERLEMWPEASLCWAAVDREDKARQIIRKLLFHASNDPSETVNEDTEQWLGPARDPVPANAARLYCMLGDIDHDPEMFEKAWEVSGARYARAKRSLGRYYFGIKNFAMSTEAYAQALKVNQLNYSTWFAYGCALLELPDFDRAVEAFTRTVQLEDTDAEAWSNLAAALLRRGPRKLPDSGYGAQVKAEHLDDEDEAMHVSQYSTLSHSQTHKLDALKALKEAARIKHDNHRIWDNILTVAASISPPVYTDIITAQRRVIEMRGATDGEACIDITILEHVVNDIVSSTDPPMEFSDMETAQPQSRYSLPRLVIDLVEKHVVPLITSSTQLWQIVAKLALWRKKPAAALLAHEKAWRAVTTQPGWEKGTEAQWNAVVTATVDLVDAYESFGPLPRAEGLGADSGQLIARDWRFKARSTARGILGRARSTWEGSSGWQKLEQRIEGLALSTS